MRYKINALDASGKKIVLLEEFANENILRAKISEAGLFLVSFAIENLEKKNPEHKKKIKKIKLAHWRLFAYQMRLLLKSGLTVDAALAEIKNINISISLNKIINELYDEIIAGGSISNFFIKRGNIAPEYFIGLIKAGELTGDLAGAFMRINSIIEEQLSLKNKIISIAVYPLILIGLSLIFFIFLVSHILPSITGIFSELNTELPAITKMVISLSDAFRNYWLAGALLLLVLFLIGRKIKNKISAQLLIEKLKMRCPLIKNIYSNYILIRITALCSALLQNNIPILTALAVALKASGSPLINTKLEQSLKSIEAGATINDTLAKLNFFPNAFLRLVRTGEKTNTLPQIFSNLNQMYSEEMNTQLKIMTSIIEPVIMICIGSVITFLILAVIIPVLKLRV